MSYYNTTFEEKQELVRSIAKNKKQEELVYYLFTTEVNYSPEMIVKLCREYYDREYPITSVRRALSDLTKKGLLKKTNKMVMGLHGKKVHTWTKKESEV